MAGFHFILIGFVLITCEGKITAPDDGTELIFLPGTTRSITWTFDDDISKVVSVTWSFTSSGGSGTPLLALLSFNTQLTKRDGVLPSFDIKKPATLILNNVNQSYNGTYRLALKIDGVRDDFISDVTVFIAITPTVTVNCSSSIILNQSDYFACEGKGQGGNPPADVTWYKGSKLIVTGKVEAILPLPNVHKDDSGTYRCEARSGHDQATNETTIELTVNYPPESTRLDYDPKSLTITCHGGEARPQARFEIFVNETNLDMSGGMYTIPERNSSYAGNYRCGSVNILGRSSSLPTYINPEGLPTLSTSTTSQTSTPSDNETVTGKDDGGKQSSSSLGVGPIIGIVIGVLVFLVIVVVVVWRYKLKKKDGYRGNPNVDPIEMDDNAYDTVKNEPSGSKSNPQASTLPVYAAVDKNNREGKPLYATLDTVAMNSDGSKRRSEESKPEPTQYASIDFERSGEVPKADLV